nr:MAG TPA: hypothetical protein [Caudoviricetes sp.]
MSNCVETCDIFKLIFILSVFIIIIVREIRTNLQVSARQYRLIGVGGTVAEIVNLLG